MKSNECYNNISKLWSGNFNEIPIHAFEQLNVQNCPYVEQPQQSVWPTMLIPTNLKTSQGYPHFNCMNFITSF